MDTQEARIRNLESSLKELEEKIAALQSREMERNHQFVAALPGNLRAMAEFTALRSMVIELAGELGLPEERVQSAYQERVNHYYDMVLRVHDPELKNLAGRIDNRTQDEIPTSPWFPPLFEPPTDQGDGGDGEEWRGSL